MSQMDAWQFDQLTVGYNLHFHSHNEFFEHFFSLGIPGALLFMYLIYFVFRSAEQISIYNKISWLLFFYVSCFWFFWAGTLPLVALGIGTLVISKKTDLQIVNKFLSNIRPNKIRI